MSSISSPLKYPTKGYHCASPPERSYYSPTRQEAYNYRQKHKSEQLGGLTPIETLVKHLTEDSDCHLALDNSAKEQLPGSFSPTNQLSNSLKPIPRSFLRMPCTEPIITTCLFYHRFHGGDASWIKFQHRRGNVRRWLLCCSGALLAATLIAQHSLIQWHSDVGSI
jgi:hypothetical protein